MAYSSAIPRQLAPTVGQEALQDLQRARTKIFVGIGKTVAIGRILFSGNVPIVPPDEFWIPAKMNPTRCSIVPIRDIHLFIGETDSGTSSLGVGGASRPAWTAYGKDTFAKGSMSDLFGVCRQRSEKFKDHPNRPCVGYKGGRSLQVRRLRLCV